MAFVHCRECGHEIKANSKQTRCDKCGSFFPFTCAVCDKFLRPPFDVYEDERYVTADNQPLCQDHYQRQCPECRKWFQADENPGYFLCLACSKEREERTISSNVTAARRTGLPAGQEGVTRAPTPSFDTVVLAVIGGSACLGAVFLLLKLLGSR